MYLIMHFFVEPVATSLEGFLSGVLSSMKDINRVSLGALLGAMMATDLGGFINKCAYHFGTASIAIGDTDFMAAVMVGGMVPPIGIALSMIFFRSHFTAAERNRGPATLIMGLAFITEGAIPFAITDFAHTFMSSVLGSAVAGGLSCYFGCTLVAPHGGIFVFPVVGNLPFYLLSLAIGSLVTAVALGSMKPVVEEEAW
jgi:PTS system fructose-specific IIC component